MMFLDGSVLFHSFGDGRCSVSYVPSLHTITGCQAAGVHIDNAEIVRRFIAVVRNAFSCMMMTSGYRTIVLLVHLLQCLVS